MRDIFLKKLEELIKLSEECNQTNSTIVLLALAGSIRSDDDGLFATMVQKIIEDVLLPLVVQKQNAIKALNN